MTRPKIKTALISIFILIGFSLALFSFYALDRLSFINGNVMEVSTDWLPSLQHSKEMDTALSDLIGAYSRHILAVTDADQQDAEKSIVEEQQRFQTELNAYDSLVAPGDPEKTITSDIRNLIDAYKKAGAEMLVLSRSGKDEDAKIAVNTKMAPIAATIAENIDRIVGINVDGSKKAYEDSQSAYDLTVNLTFIIIGTIGLFLAGGIYFGWAQIARPIEKITGSMTHLAAGDIARSIPFAGRSDEIGEMAGAVEIFRQAAISNRRLEEEAEANRVQAEADRIRLTAEAEAAAQKRLQEATSGLAVGLRRLAAGDLDFQLDDPFAPDFEALRHDLNGAVGQLGQTLRSVAQATSQIDSGTQEISQSAEDLSKRTEQQAASLEETAAALDQITVNVANSSKRAEEARSVAVQANASAAQSGKVVASAVNAMQKIEASSNQVTNIIGVIDEIAFQTNLLALNAGVEAARAGEAGKGFAVVAQEVRELAQRSAQAAKEIKELIRNSSVEVQSGVKLVSETGDALKTIEGYIVTVNQHMDAIATSAREQSTGLAEVNTAVNQMDQVTQQNAAMVEESNAASAALASEAGRLRGLISQFQLGGESGSQAAALRQTASVMAAPRRAATTMRPISHGNTALKQEDWEEF
nr:methyl-accepting chemotaxis protein [uncultured Shinella sp.]